MPSELPHNVKRCPNESCPIRDDCLRYHNPQDPWGYVWGEWFWVIGCEGHLPLDAANDTINELLFADPKEKK